MNISEIPLHYILDYLPVRQRIPHIKDADKRAVFITEFELNVRLEDVFDWCLL